MRSGLALAVVVIAACGEPRASAPPNPLDYARMRTGVVLNMEAAVPPMCYTATGGTSNPCWVCHTQGQGRTFFDDGDLQESYAFSDTARTNHWTNLFVD